MKHWLMKTEPDAFSIDNLKKVGTEPWSGVRNYQARNFMRQMEIGDLDIHELGICKTGKVVFVNTKYSCIAELSQTHSFKPIWKPAFISKLAPEDRCHLNGLAMKLRAW